MYMQDLSLFTYKEAINMILGFYTFTKGFWESDLDDYPEVKRFIEYGYAQKDEKYNELFVKSEAGTDLLHEYIKSISESFIKYMKEKGSESPCDDVNKWFKEKFNIETDFDSEEIALYIAGNLRHYGYKIIRCFSTRRGRYYIMEPLTQRT